MKMTLYVDNKLVNEVKKLVRKNNLYFENNPLPLFTNTEIKLEGDVKNFNAFNKDYWDLLDKEATKEPEKKNNFNILKNFLRGIF